MKAILCFALLFLLSIQQVFSQTAAELKYVGTYESTDILELSLSIRKLEIGFEVQMLIQGQLYKGEALALLGILSGGYDYQGNYVEFTVSKVLDQYVLTTEGYDIPLSRTQQISTDLSELAAKPTETTSNPNSPQKATSSNSTSVTETEATQQLKQRIIGKRLLYLHTANGGSDKKFFDLCSNGSFYYSSNYSYLSGGFSGVTTDEDYGTWQVGTIGNGLGLILNTQKGEYIEMVITPGNSQSELLGNGRRYFISTNETCN